MKSDLYISVDIEADGPIPGEYSMLSLGAYAVNGPLASTIGDSDGQLGRTFYVELQPISSGFVPEALTVSGLDRERLARTRPSGVSPGRTPICSRDSARTRTTRSTTPKNRANCSGACSP